MLVLVCWSPASAAPAWEVPCPCLAGNTCAWVLFNQHLDLPHLSARWLILLDFNKCVLNIWKKKLFCVHTKEKLWKKIPQTCEINGSNKQSVAFIVQFVFKWAQNLAGLKLVFNKFGVLWQPHWLCARYWIFTAKLTPPHTLQNEISCCNIPCWSPAYQHQNTTYAGLAGHKLCWSMLFFPAGIS